MWKKNNNNNNKKTKTKNSMARKPVKSTEERIGQLDIGQWKISILDNTEYGETLKDVRLLQKSWQFCHQSPGRRE